MQRRADHTVLFQHVQYGMYSTGSLMSAIELQNVAIAAHARVADQVACVLNRKKVLSRCHRTLIVAGKFGLQFIIERIAGFLVPSQPVWLKSVRVSNRRREVETSICVHRQLISAL